MKYRCRICGYEGVGESLPVDECPACGMADEWEANPFDARCIKCGQGYYESEVPNFCPKCGERIGAPEPCIVVKGVTADDFGDEGMSPSRRSGGSSFRGASGASSSPPDMRWVKTLFKVLGILIAVGLACFVGYYVLSFLWAVICFIFRHWIISLIVVGLILYGASKA